MLWHFCHLTTVRTAVHLSSSCGSSAPRTVEASDYTAAHCHYSLPHTSWAIFGQCVSSLYRVFFYPPCLLANKRARDSSGEECRWAEDLILESFFTLSPIYSVFCATIPRFVPGAMRRQLLYTSFPKKRHGTRLK